MVWNPLFCFHATTGYVWKYSQGTKKAAATPFQHIFLGAADDLKQSFFCRKCHTDLWGVSSDYLMTVAVFTQNSIDIIFSLIVCVLSKVWNFRF